MKKFVPVAVVLSVVAFFSSCDKGDDNPYGNWKCTCFVTKTYTTPNIVDTVVLNQNDMDKNTAKTYCENAKKGYIASDTGAVTATCTLK